MNIVLPPIMHLESRTPVDALETPRTSRSAWEFICTLQYERKVINSRIGVKSSNNWLKIQNEIHMLDTVVTEISR